MIEYSSAAACSSSIDPSHFLSSSFLSSTIVIVLQSMLYSSIDCFLLIPHTAPISSRTWILASPLSSSSSPTIPSKPSPPLIVPTTTLHPLSPPLASLTFLPPAALNSSCVLPRTNNSTGSYKRQACCISARSKRYSPPTLSLS